MNFGQHVGAGFWRDETRRIGWRKDEVRSLTRELDLRCQASDFHRSVSTLIPAIPTPGKQRTEQRAIHKHEEVLKVPSLLLSLSISIMATYTITAEPSSSGFELNTFPTSENPSQKRLEISDLEDVRGEASPPDTAVEALQTWHSPRINMFRVFATFWSFLIIGMNDGSYGALVPHV